MKVLLLEEETWRRMTDVLATTDAGWALLGELEQEIPVPPDRALIECARNGDEPPAAVAHARDARLAGVEAARVTRDHVAELVRHCYGAGVGPAVLSRWFGLMPRRVYEILDLTTTKRRGHRRAKAKS
jgi:hypothetical protein